MDYAEDADDLTWAIAASTSLPAKHVVFLGISHWVSSREVALYLPHIDSASIEQTDARSTEAELPSGCRTGADTEVLYRVTGSPDQERSYGSLIDLLGAERIKRLDGPLGRELVGL
jgi:hypothetical protein